MSAVATETATEKTVQPKEMTFELVDTQPSGYVMDGPGMGFDNLDETAQISFPSIRMIRRTSRIKVKQGDTFIYKKIRYINGCPIIDFDEQNKQGFKPNPLADYIVFKDGKIKATREGDIALYDYLMACEYNVDAPNRPDDAHNIFKALDPAMTAEEEETLIDLKGRCMDVLKSLKIAKTGGGFRYNEDMLQFLCVLFKIDSFDTGFGSEAWVALAKFADDKPAVFLNSINDARSIIEADVFNAVSLGVITIDEQRVYYSDGGALIMSVEEGLTPDMAGQAVVDFMSNPKNRDHYDTMRVKIKNAKMKDVEVIK